MLTKMKVRKKDGTIQEWNSDKITAAVSKSAERINVIFNDQQINSIIGYVEHEVDRIAAESGTTLLPIKTIHSLVEAALEYVEPRVAKSYKDYRNYKVEFAQMMDEVYKEDQKIRYIGDRSNANSDSTLVSTQRSLCYNSLNTKLYEKFFCTKEELQAQRDGYIYIHDRSARRDTWNCCLFRMGEVLKGGFEMGNVWYNEPKTLDTAFDVMGDVILMAAAQQYGGFTVPEIDKVLGPYAEKSFQKYLKEYNAIYEEIESGYVDEPPIQALDIDKCAEAYAYRKVKREMEQGYQGIEIKLNTVASSRGDYPFVTITFGLGTSVMEKMASKTILEVHAEGQGKKGFKKPVLFPKLVFLYDEELHGPGCINEDVFEAGIYCSSKTMYPDWLSLTGEGYVPSMYKKYKKVVSPMGCRAFLSPWYERGGMHPADDSDVPVFEGRFNLGVISLNLPMIYAKAQRESEDFWKVLDYYLQLIRGNHRRTYDYIGEMKASRNPLAFCEGGFLGGHLEPDEKIKPILKSCTISFGITALNELQRLYNGKSIAEDGEFALEVMKYIDKRVKEFKEEDGILYAVYGTPAESLCGLQVQQFRNQYGIIENVSDREYVSNSFHCHVTEDISPVQKQDLEYRFWDLCNGGKIQYVRYNIGYNVQAIKALVRRAMKMGFYEGVNLALNYCENCGHQEVDMDDVCPVCGSRNITKVDRMNGYLGYSRTGRTNRDAVVDENGRVVNMDKDGNTIVVQDDGNSVTVSKHHDLDSVSTSRFNRAKNAEIKERISM
ncbi:MAG: anaerobic ribonucleoside-triphosphate reductase [Oliverpabstia sp.]|nr:anaerobic ribonucleoside-triphosphate reductase [Oliverpabstia sp.]